MFRDNLAGPNAGFASRLDTRESRFVTLDAQCSAATLNADASH